MFELNLDRSLRKIKGLIPAITLLAAAILLFGLYLCIVHFRDGNFWTIVPAGLLAHSFVIIIVHDGAHKAITRSRFDRIFMNIGAAIVLIPFYGEPFRRFHLIHHGNTNSEIDPLWPPAKKQLFETKRWLYVLCELVPLLFTFYLIFQIRSKHKRQKVKGPKINYWYILSVVPISIAIIYWVKPQLLFVLGTFFFLNVFSSLRHWCEHLGYSSEKSTNTYSFPLGMGIGNHLVHHDSPQISWFALMIGLFLKKKDTNPLKAAYGVLFKKSYHLYKEE